MTETARGTGTAPPPGAPARAAAARAISAREAPARAAREPAVPARAPAAPAAPAAPPAPSLAPARAAAPGRRSRTDGRSRSRTGTDAGARASAVGRARPQPALVAVAHGSRDPEALRTVDALLDRVRALRPGLTVRLGHLELNEPLLTGTLIRTLAETRTVAGDGGPRAVLVPLLFSRGHHVTHDIPRILAAGAPGLDARIAAPLGPHRLLVEALYGRLTEAGWSRHRPRAGVVLAAAGSRHPGSAADTLRTAHLLSARLGGTPVIPGYASAAEPTVPDAVRALRAAGCDPAAVAVASCFTAPGRFATACATAVPGSMASAPLGAHPAMAELVLERYDEALADTGGRALAAPSGRCTTVR